MRVTTVVLGITVVAVVLGNRVMAVVFGIRVVAVVLGKEQLVDPKTCELEQASQVVAPP